MRSMFAMLAMVSLGCATTYHPKDINGGYYDRYDYEGYGRNQDRIVSVGFEGNGHTSFEEVEQMAWRRATEKCKENGYTYFCLIEQKNIQDPSAFGRNVVLIKAWCN